jgi:pimeloyl-ACP methyl ester carboxylesterase
LVFLHDALGSVEGWKNLPLELCQTLELNGLAYDRIGHGKSPLRPDNYSPDYMKDAALKDLKAVIDHFQIEHPVLIGHSDGGTIALIYAAAYKNAVALVSMAGHIMVEDITRRGIEEAILGFREPELMKRLGKYHGAKTESLVKRWEKIWLSDEFRNWNISRDLSSIKCPSLLIQGREDEYATVKHCEKIKNAIGDHAHMKILENVRHFPHRESPELVKDLIIEFLKQLASDFSEIDLVHFLLF